MKKLIGDTQFRSSLLNQDISKHKSVLSYELNEIEALANSLDIADNDTEIFQMIKDKRNKTDNLKNVISRISSDIDENGRKISYYEQIISELDVKEQSYFSELDNLENYTVDENQRNKDIKKMNRFQNILDIINLRDILKDMHQDLSNLAEELSDEKTFVNIDEKIDTKNPNSIPNGYGMY